MLGYQKFNYSGSVVDLTNYGAIKYSAHFEDNLISGIARITFNYLTKPNFSIYSGVGIGITVNMGKLRYNDEQLVKTELYPAGQLTFLGLQFGRALKGFLELGAGSFGIVNAGLSFNFTKAVYYTTDTVLKTRLKSSYTIRNNELYLGYGGFSIFYFSGNFARFDNTYSDSSFSPSRSPGTIFMGYNRLLGRMVSIGFLLAYQNFHTSGRTILYYTKPVPVAIDDRLITAIARVNLSYINKPSVKMYSGIGIGLTLDFKERNFNSARKTDFFFLPGAQLTLIGIRFGKALGGFIEAGAGSYGIVNAGLSYKFRN